MTNVDLFACVWLTTIAHLELMVVVTGQKKAAADRAEKPVFFNKPNLMGFIGYWVSLSFCGVTETPIVPLSLEASWLKFLCEKMSH